MVWNALSGVWQAVVPAALVSCNYTSTNEIFIQDDIVPRVHLSVFEVLTGGHYRVIVKGPYGFASWITRSRACAAEIEAYWLVRYVLFDDAIGMMDVVQRKTIVFTTLRNA
jgi:hypothetical protein